MTVDMLAQVAAKWLLCHLQCGALGKAIKRVSGGHGMNFNHTSQNGMHFKIYSFSISYLKTKDCVSS